MSQNPRRGDRPAASPVGRAQRAQLPPAAGRHRRGRGRLGDRRRGPALPRLLAAYSAINFGHRHPRLVAAAQRQLDRVTLVSRAFHHDQFGPFCAELAALAGMEMVLPMNSGAEAVETAIKTARKWGYEVKGVPADEAVIVAFERQLPRPHHDDHQLLHRRRRPRPRSARSRPASASCRYGDAEALAAAIDERVVAVLVEPIQGEAGMLVPPAGFLASVRETLHAVRRADGRR